MSEKYTPGDVIHGFLLKEKRFVAEINSECLLFSHLKSGARLFKIVNSDPNKTFCIGFKTFPGSDNGVAHILEHSVLNGSGSFPVKSPFDVLLKGSLNTFLNAFTSKDFTMYPVASMNRRDYFNLMHVYLDAVFNPLIYHDSRILKQEGWHYELDSQEDEIRIKGVVYNEMKGSFSNPQRVLWYQVFRHLFPDNIYRWESGGTPEAIPSLTEEQFIAFHKKYYHPENSYIFLYGDADLQRELKFMDEKYLSKFDFTGTIPVLNEQKPFAETRDIVEYYAYLGEDGIENQTFITWNGIAGYNTDLSLTVLLDILCEALVNQESAPVRLALAEAGIGKDVNASSSNFYQHAIQVAVLNANPEDKPGFLRILNETLTKVVARGLDKTEIEGILNRMEFRLREGDDSQKGLMYLNTALPAWFFAEDPFTGLEYEKYLADVKTKIANGFLENLIQRYFLDNPNTLILTLAPSVTLDQERTSVLNQSLTDLKNQLPEEKLAEMSQETRELTEYQQREDSPEALAKIPMLSISDIDRVAPFYKADMQTIAGLPGLVYEQFTNNVLYSSLIFDLGAVPMDRIPYITLLCALAGSMNTEHYSFSELNKLLNINTGGFYLSTRIYLRQWDDETMMPKLVVSSKAMTSRSDKMAGLIAEILANTIYDDPERLKTLLMRHHSQLDAQIKGNGYQVASKRLGSYISRQGYFREITAGLTYYRFITGLIRDFSSKSHEIISTLQWLAENLFTRQNLVYAISGDQKPMMTLAENLFTISGSLPDITPVQYFWDFDLVPKNEGILSASNVQYVLKGANFKRNGYSWSSKMRVLNQVLSTDWLQNRIRVVGGAYGGFSSIAPDGNFILSSYRDPNLRKTLENFNQTPDYLRRFDANESAMTRYILGTISGLDHPLTNAQTFEKAVIRWFAERTEEEFQKERDMILEVTARDIRDYAALTEEVLKQDIHCVYGNAETLKKEASLFLQLIDTSDQ